MTHLVFGALSFPGVWIVKKLLAQGLKVEGFDSGNSLKAVLGESKLPIHSGDISNFQNVSEVVNKVKPTFIYHFAETDALRCASAAREGASVNALGTVNVFQACKELKLKEPSLVKSIVYLSSAVIYGNTLQQGGSIQDAGLYKPQTIYGVYKLANEGTARLYWESDQIPSFGFRPLTLYGYGAQGHGSDATAAIQAAILGKSTQLKPGHSNFLYVEDFAEIVTQVAPLIKDARAGSIQSSSETIENVVKAIHQNLPGGEKLVPHPKNGTRSDPHISSTAFNFSGEQLKGVTGGKPIRLTSLSDGIKKTVQVMQQLKSKSLLGVPDVPLLPEIKAYVSKQGTEKEVFLITGAQGFIGGWVIKKLMEEKKKVQLILTDLKKDLFVLEQILGKKVAESLNIEYGDIADYNHVRDLVLKTKPTHVIHLAALQIPACRANPRAGAIVNVIGTVNVFEAVKELQEKFNHHVNCVVYASSAGACGPASDYKDGIVDDDAHHVSRAHYGVYKLCNEGTAEVYAKDYDIPSIGLRPMTVYGVGREVGVTSDPTKAIRAVLLGKPFEIAFKGPTSFNYVEEIAELFLMCVRKVTKGTYMCSIKGTEGTVEEFVSILTDLLPSTPKYITIKEDAITLPYPYRFSARTLTQLFGKAGDCSLSLRDGIKRVISQFQDIHGLPRSRL